MRYRIDPAAVKSVVAKVKCPECAHVFTVSLVKEESISQQKTPPDRPVVLVVDDARFFREMIIDILKNLPIEIMTAADGLEAWQQITALTPQLILLDLNIPSKSGKEILLSLQDSSHCDQIKVLVMSGVERGEGIASEVRNLGADAFISKSFKPKELESLVRSLLDL
jgi:DNA-binding response OmpR family regulator